MAALLVETLDGQDVELARGQQPQLPALSRRRPDVAPAVALTHPQQLAPPGQPPPIVDHVQPGRILIAEEPARFGRGRVDQPDVVALLQAIQALQDQLTGLLHPLRSRQVVIRDSPGKTTQRGSPPAALTIPSFTAEFVVPTFG